MAVLKYYFPKVPYEETLRKRKEILQFSDKLGFDASTGLTIQKSGEWKITLHTDIPNDFDMSKYELVYQEVCNVVNSLSDFDKFASNENQTRVLNANGVLRREFGNGDILEINGDRYYCLTSGWKKV